MRKERACWCGNDKLTEFNLDYGKCGICGTLVLLNFSENDQPTVQDDLKDFYGKRYWLEHQQNNFGYPSIYDRVRNDLTERNLHWLKTLMKYCLPPANMLELGCSHGSFVALLKQAGYLASGVEMSPWVVAFGQETFSVPIYVGPVEHLDIPSASLDVIVLMDVLEHLPNPTATISHCLKLLKPNGILLMQTPEFKEEMNYPHLLEEQSPFLEQLKADEHLYLFSQRSITTFLQAVGAEHIAFEPAIFSQYDMFLVASRTPLKTYEPTEWEDALLKTPDGRLTLALLDIRDRELTLTQKLQESERDRADRLNQIHTLTTWLQAAQTENSCLKTENFHLKDKLERSPLSMLSRGLSKISDVIYRKSTQ
jgi:2-polyprenyl-3-methyl-5-hydroxy-6-metoxy-1,4-benzoquinol methylase